MSYIVTESVDNNQTLYIVEPESDQPTASLFATTNQINAVQLCHFLNGGSQSTENNIAMIIDASAYSQSQIKVFADAATAASSGL